MAKKVFLGVGHGGSDPGAVANGFKESNLNLAIALACQDELARHGVLVKMSRKKDENDPLAEEIKECNAFNPDLAVDIHNNAGGGDGAEVLHSINGGTGKTLANNILTEIKKIGQNSRGAKTKKNSSGKDYFGFIRQIKAPAVIVECAFVDNKKDIKIIDTKAEQMAMGVAIAKGILKTLGVAYIDPKKQETANQETTKKETAAEKAEREEKEKTTTSLIVNAIIIGVIALIIVALCIKFRKKLGEFLRSVKSELGKIVWASKENTRKSFLVVIVVAIAVAIIIGLIDFAFGTGISMLDSFLDGILK